MARMRNDTDYYFGRKLSHGSLRISDKYSSLPARIMIDRGLSDLHFVFGEAYEGMHGDTWVVPVRSARQTLETAPEKSLALLEQWTVALDIALAFGGDWRLPFATQ